VTAFAINASNSGLETSGGGPRFPMPNWLNKSPVEENLLKAQLRIDCDTSDEVAEKLHESNAGSCDSY